MQEQSLKNCEKDETFHKKRPNSCHLKGFHSALVQESTYQLEFCNALRNKILCSVLTSQFTLTAFDRT